MPATARPATSSRRDSGCDKPPCNHGSGDGYSLRLQHFMAAPSERLAPGERLIVAYKLARAVISLAGAITLGILFGTHRLMAMHFVAFRLLEHNTSAFSIK